MPGKIPFGYRIRDGKAEIDEADAMILKTYYSLFLKGETMASAARQAGLEFSSSSLPNLFRRKEYVGTDYYPAIITEEYQKQLIQEHERRKALKPMPPQVHTKKAVKIHTSFCLVGAVAEQSEDPVECASVLYQRIRPKESTAKAPRK